MSVKETPHIVDPAAAETLPAVLRAASLRNSFRKKKSGQDLRESRQDSRQADQDMQQTDQDLRETRQDSRESTQDSRQTGQDTRESRQDLRQVGQDLQQTSQDLRETRQNLRESNLALLESEERFRLLVDSSTDCAIYMLDPEGRVVTWNEGAERSKGYKAEEILGRNYAIFFLAEDVEAGLPARELAAAARDNHFETEAWRRRKDGAKFWALVTLTAIRGPEGELRGFAKVTRDLTAQKVAEEALRTHNAQLECYRIIVENVVDYVIFTLDAEGRIDSWSPGAMNVLGFAAEEALGREYSLVFTPEEIEAGEPRQEMEAAARSGRYATEGWRVRRDGSLFWASGVTTAIRDKAGRLAGYIRVARDMTAHKRLEEARQGMAADLESRVVERTGELKASVAELQGKNREIEAFVYIVSHDLRAPLVNLQGFVRELEESGKHLKAVIQACPERERCWPGVLPVLDEEIAGALHFISASATKFERLINALLNFSRQGRQVYQPARVNVWELATSAVATFQKAIVEAGAEVEMGNLPSVTADSTALGQVFSNLIGNAIKYRNPECPLRVEVGGQAEDGMVHYWVRDNGLGIPEYGKARLFQVFQRLHPDQAEGEGMGLAIAHRIVERHGGRIWAESREGKGTSIHFSLPGNHGSAPNVA